METTYFCVADHCFSVSAPTDVFALMENYRPFAVAEGSVVFALSVAEGVQPLAFEEELRQEEEGQVIVCGHTAEGQQVFEFYWTKALAGRLVCQPGYHSATLAMGREHRKLAVDNALMILYALATADKCTALFHSAVVSYEGRGYMFLGKSGTGKSTHAALWLKHVEGTERVNDDNPVVRIADGQARVYGSPWSGKTPCYRNVSHPVGGIVQLSQAPFNRISPLRGVQAYAVLLPSISGMRWNRTLADGLHRTEEQLAASVPFWHLECLPDEAAAILCRNHIVKKD